LNKKMPILVQLILGFSIILLVVMSMTSYFSYRYSSQVVLKNTAQYLFESVIQMKGKIDVALNEYDKMSQLMSFSSQVQDYFISVNQGLRTPESQYEIERFIGTQSRILGNYDYFLMDNVGNNYKASNTLFLFWKSEEELEPLPWYSLVREYNGRMVWVAGKAYRDGTIPVVIGARQLNNWKTLDKLGNIFIVFPVETLERIIGQINLGQSGKIQVIDQLGKIVYSTKSVEIGEDVEQTLLNKMENHENEMFDWDVNGKHTYISHSASDYSGWSVVAYIDAEEAVKDLEKVKNSIMIIGIFGIIAALLFTTFFSWTLTRPIRLLAMRLGRLEKGFLSPSKGFMGNQEVSVLYDNFNHMLVHLNQTIKDLSDKQISEKQAQIVALKAQFRPHFLYNSLNTIYWTLINENEEKVAKMVLTLSDLLRYSIQPGSETVTVEEDLNQLKRFLDISRARYGEKLETEIEVEQGLLQNRMMKLLLQPLVENAITHGLEDVKGRPWKISIRIYRDEQYIHFTVEDNGKGMSEAEMKEVLKFRGDIDVKNLMHSGIGLANLHYRIGLIYGKEYGLQLSTGSLGGLKADVKIPLAIEDMNVLEEE
jgi:two-component system sensor histidine kinase YesM